MTDILHWENRKTRKPHRCFGCSKTYPAGSFMINAAYADGGEAYSCYWCSTCVEYMHRYFHSGDEAGEGDIFDRDPEAWEEIKREQEAQHDGSAVRYDKENPRAEIEITERSTE